MRELYEIFPCACKILALGFVRSVGVPRSPLRRLRLSLGIGANTSIFTLIDAILLEPLPYPQSSRIVQLWLAYPGSGGLVLSIPEINLLEHQTTVFQDFAAYDFGGPGVNITGRGEPEQVKAIHVSSN
jgi:hypothetical protein